MRGLKTRTADVGRARSRELARRFGEELRIARLSAGLTQRVIARRAALSQTTVSLAERGHERFSLEVRCRLATACGHELGWKLYPIDGVSLRDGGLALAKAIAAAAHPSWEVRMEVPVSRTDRRAADMLLSKAEEIVHVEIERLAFDGQAQIRAAQLKRSALASATTVPVRLVIALPDTAANRDRIGAFRQLFEQSFPVGSASTWTAIRRGRPIGADAILFVRLRPRDTVR